MDIHLRCCLIGTKIGWSWTGCSLFSDGFVSKCCFIISNKSSRRLKIFFGLCLCACTFKSNFWFCLGYTTLSVKSLQNLICWVKEFIHDLVMFAGFLQGYKTLWRLWFVSALEKYEENEGLYPSNPAFV